MASILIVDDMAILKELIAAALSAAGYTARCAGGARDALESARTSRPDVVLLEPAAGDGGGMRFLRALRADPNLSRVPVIVLTAVSGRVHVLEAARLGVTDYVLKARSSVKDLLDRVARCASVSAGAEPAANKAAATSTRAAAGARPAAGNPAAAEVSAAPGPAEPVARPSVRVIADGPPPRLLTREQCLKRTEDALQAKTLSGVVAQVVAMAASPRSDMTHLAEMIARDMVLSAKVLQAANSAAYASGRGMIASIPDAVRHIGCSTIRNIAAAVGVFEAMPDTGADGFNPIRCWQHSFAVARLCEQLSARQSPEDAGTAYLAGLCHDLGDILFRTHFGTEYAQVLAVHDACGTPLRQLEREMLGITQAELSLTILRCLALPQTIRDPIEELHRDAEPRQPIGRILRLADAYANGLLLAAGGGEMLTPLGKADCRRATGEDSPATPDGDAFRSEILALTLMLARLDHADARRLMEPLHRPGEARLWLAREAGLSAFDPIAAALGALGRVQVSERLPTREEAGGVDGLVVVARSVAAAGLDAAAVADAAGHTLPAGARTLPTLWLAGGAAAIAAMAGRAPSGAIAPRAWPISIDELAAFVGTCASSRSARAA
jgi:HD-like signal output (HDOD) protein/DNA-binding response OmpR family regulator